MTKQTTANEGFAVLIDAATERHRRAKDRGFERLLCNHVYFQFCPSCPQYRCEKRRI